ncbi:hypothetical protein GOODEAATRI_031722 [Goodea atripinnis]|uniref:Uncharacterized protein n=1 Tax=Goodea atripinnis TaxID=208336 RepID=A0ABV0PIP9_9TELE
MFANGIFFSTVVIRPKNIRHHLFEKSIGGACVVILFLYWPKGLFCGSDTEMFGSHRAKQHICRCFHFSFNKTIQQKNSKTAPLIEKVFVLFIPPFHASGQVYVYLSNLPPGGGYLT